MRLMILNGPNLNLLGEREPDIYGSTTLSAIQAGCEQFAELLGAQLSFHQSNHEGVLVDLIQSAQKNSDAIIINPAGYSFTSIAILDALRNFKGRFSKYIFPIFTHAISFTDTQSSLQP